MMLDEAVTPHRRSLWHVAGWGTLATCVFFYRAVFTADVFFWRDVFRVYYPLRKFLAEELRAGRFPEWYPYDALGQPFVGMTISGVLHPLNALYLLLPLGSAYKLNVLLCFPVAAVGMWLLARSWRTEALPAGMAALAYAMSGYLVSMTANLLYLMAAATVPWALWAAHRFCERPSVLRAAGAALVLALIVFAGDPQSFAVTSGLVALLIIARGASRLLVRAGQAVGVLALAAALGAAQILPSLLTAAESGVQRWTQQDALTWSLSPWRLGELLLGPYFMGTRSQAASVELVKVVLGEHGSSLWADSLHLGAPVFALAITGGVSLWPRRRDFWTLILPIALFFILLLGRHTPLYPLMWDHFPLWKSFRYPEKLFPFLMVPVALLAGQGLQAVLASQQRRRQVTWGLLSAAGLLTVWVAGLSAAGSDVLSSLPGPPSAGAQLRLWGDLVQGSGVATGIVLLSAILLRYLKPALHVAVGLMLLQFGHIVVSNHGVYLLTLPDLLQNAPPFARLIQERSQPLSANRVYSGLFDVNIPYIHPQFEQAANASTWLGLVPDTQALWGLEAAGSYLPAAHQRYSELFPKGAPIFPRYLGLISCSYVCSSESTYFDIVKGPPEAIIAVEPEFEMVLFHKAALPRAYLSRPGCVSRADGLEVLRAPGVNLRDVSVTECEGTALEAAARAELTQERGTVEILRRDADEVELEVEARVPSLLVLTDAFYSGWTATVGGAPAQILPVNHLVRGVMVPEGRRRVVFRYRTPGLRAGAGISLASGVSVLGAALFFRRRRSGLRGQVVAG